MYLREALVRQIKDFLWNHFIKWRPPSPSPFYEVPIYLFPSIFWAKSRDDFEECWIYEQISQEIFNFTKDGFPLHKKVHCTVQYFFRRIVEAWTHEKK